MIIALMMGRSGSRGLKNKNLLNIYGKKLFEYPLLAAKKSNYINDIYVSTDCPVIKKISKKKYNAKIINRPKHLCNSNALGENVYEHGYFEIKKTLDKNLKKIEYIVLLMANSATLTSKMIDKGINFLRKNKSYDSAVSTSVYNMWSPLRARKLDRGNLKPFVPFKIFGDPNSLNCDRDSQGDVYFADMSVSVVRPKCLENLGSGLLPQKWMGTKIAPIKSDAGFDVDYEWQIPQLKYWLKKNKVV